MVSLVTIEERGKDLAITLETTFFGFFKKRRTYIGRYTVWHSTLDGRRPGTMMEKLLSEIEWKYRHENSGK